MAAKKDNQFTLDVDKFASELLAKAKEGDDKVYELSVFKEIIRWVAIKNRLSSEDDEGGLDELKQQLGGNHAKRTPRAGNHAGPNWDSAVQTARINKRWEAQKHPAIIKGYDEGNGRGIADLRARVSARPDRDDDGGIPGPGNDPGGPGAAPDSPAGVYLDVVGSDAGSDNP